ncbi:hypothetical protein KFE25_004753 [Diacronema lutheri]|uniref:Uncharacterized protein n=1 Tax=Diacronema lutheri TaxID=2081491 RepID=A0A8J5XFB1_DIALT|nr:hypothetical protein KFE25_004753 [Diacronema lutheri]
MTASIFDGNHGTAFRLLLECAPTLIGARALHVDTLRRASREHAIAAVRLAAMFEHWLSCEVVAAEPVQAPRSGDYERLRDRVFRSLARAVLADARAHFGARRERDDSAVLTDVLRACGGANCHAASHQGLVKALL